MERRPEPYNALEPVVGGGSAARLGRRVARRLRREAVARGLMSPAALGWRWVPRRGVAEAVSAYARRGASRRVLQPAGVADHALPRNVERRDQLPADAGWWGYSLRDVPSRASGETAMATLPDCRVVQTRDPQKQNDYYPAILTADGGALDLRELRFRDGHARVLRAMAEGRREAAASCGGDGGGGGGGVERLDEVTWITERVFDNHSHWLTAHLPKLLLLRELGEAGALARVVLPARRPASIDQTLRLAGLDPEGFASFDDTALLEVRRLTLLETDRFRPELLRLIPAAFGVDDAAAPDRRVYVSRSKASRRRLRNEDAVWPIFAQAGFERVWMEELSLPEQVALMKRTAALAGPHGAGLTNMLFCPAGCRVLEIADLSFPNPNFYAIAAAMGHAYWLLDAGSVGEGHPLEKDLEVDVEAVRRTLELMLEGLGSAAAAGPGGAGWGGGG